MTKNNKLNAIQRMYYYSSDLLGGDPISEEDKNIENHPNGYSYCNGCKQWFHNNDIMVVEDIGMHFCFACLYSIATLYFGKDAK